MVGQIKRSRFNCMGNMLQQETVPLISVIMPVYNSALYLPEAIESVLNQTLRDFELLIVYDESSDGSLAIIERYQQNDSRIRVIYGKKKALIGALNQGIEAAQGKFIARMDADDISLPERFEKQVLLMESDGADICGCHFFVVNESGKLVDAKLVPLCRETFIICLACTVPFAHGSVMMRSSFIQQHGLRYGGVRYAEDYDLWIRFFEKEAVFANVNEFLFKYRDTEVSLFKQVSKQNAKDTRKLNRLFVRRNSVACIDALRELTDRYSTLSMAERDLVLLASYIALINMKSSIFFTIVKQSSVRSIGKVLLYW